MSLAIVYSRASMGVQAPLVTIEVHLSNGKPSFTLVGLPEKTVKEAQDRVRSALLNAEFKYPAKRITVNLAPADLPKEGGRFDLPIAINCVPCMVSFLRFWRRNKPSENALLHKAMPTKRHWFPSRKPITPILYWMWCNFLMNKGSCLLPATSKRKVRWIFSLKIPKI